MSLEYVSLSDKDFDRIASKIDKEYPESCIVSIERVIRDRSVFDERVLKIKSEGNDPEVTEMFHGTKEKYVDSILKLGFLSEKNTTSAYGVGTYFSPMVRLSLTGYTDISKKSELSYVFLCEIIKSEAGGNGKDIFVCPDDDTCIPTFLIRFYKNANKM